MTSPSVTVNQSELAGMLRVSTKSVQQWDRDGLAEVARLGQEGREIRYDAVAAFWWYHERELDRLRQAHDQQADKEAAARLRKLEAEAESKELDVAVKRGDLVPLDEVESLVRESLEAVDSVLRHAPSQFAPSLAKAAKVSIKDARTLLRDAVELVRGAIRDNAKAVADGE